MTALCIIFGIIMIIGGFCCMFTPLATLMGTEYFIVVLVTVVGVIGLIKSIAEKRFGAGFVFSILSIIFGIAVLCFPNLMVFTNGILVYMVAAWFVLMGFVSITTAITVAGLGGSKLWIFQLIFGILAIVLGGYSFFHPMLIALSMGFLIGFYFIETGFTLLFAPAMKP